MLPRVFVRIVSLLKSTVDDSVVVYNKIINLTDSKSTNRQILYQKMSRVLYQ